MTTEVFRLVVQFELRMRMERMYDRARVVTVTVTLAIFLDVTCD